MDSVNSGETTTTASTINQPQHLFIANIYDEWYDEEVQKYVIEFSNYSGDQFVLHLKKRDIERFNLFMRKIDAEYKWLQHIINN